MIKRSAAAVLAFSPAALFAEGGTSIIQTIVGKAGFAGWTTIGLSMVAFTMVFKMMMDLGASKILPEDVLTDVETALEEEDYEGAYSAVQEDYSFLGRVLEGGLSKMNYGYEAIEKGADEAWTSEQTSLMQTASYVQLIGQLAPMLGLFGTVFGMMQAFQVLAHSAGAANPKDLASGIMNSLVTTFIGLLVAIPCNSIYLWIRNKIVKAGLDVGNASNEILTTLRGEEE